jgi:hypothetical protein
MNRAAWVGLGAIVFMFLEPWIKPWLDRRPRPRPPEPDQTRPPIRGTLLRPGRELDRGDR